jgi:hypothetical protein
MRHDIDVDVDAALRLARLERQVNSQMKATYFVLLTSEFYNVFAKRSLEGLVSIAGLGHELGLHFDETKYPEASSDSLVDAMHEEASTLGRALGIEVKTVSMHMPSKRTLDANYDLGTLVNSYSARFFREFKYLSDSKMHWREDAETIIKSHQYDNLHLLTHAFWYSETPQTAPEIMRGFAARAQQRTQDNLQVIHPF